jgi:hypothetical protein
MAAEIITLRVFVMGLAAVLSRDGGGLDIVLPRGPNHVAVLVYPCGDSACKGEAKKVSDDLGLPPQNYDPAKGLLAFKNAYFGAVELNGVKLHFQPSPSASSAATSPSHGGRHHHWYSDWWFHWAGEVPSKGNSADVSWIPSLSEIAPCADKLKEGDKLFADNTLAVYLPSSIGALGPPIVASVGSMKEFETGFCQPSGTDKLRDYSPTLSFGSSPWPFSAPNQATADMVVFTTTITGMPTITLETMSGPLPAVSPGVGGAKTVDILIANLMPLSGDYNKACVKTGLPHIHYYASLLSDPTCVLPCPRLGWLSRRIAKDDLQQSGDFVPSVVRVVSEVNATILTGGYSRPLCFMVTN